MHRLAVAAVAGVTAAAVAWRIDRGLDGSDDAARAATAASDRDDGDDGDDDDDGCDGFDFPVGPPDATGYYNAQPFGANDHLGDDWNGLGGGDTDLGDPVVAIADGVVASARDHGGGWGRVVRVVHACGVTVESVYAHLATIDVEPGARIRRGDPIGTIGTANGRYLAHLHLELRAEPGLPLGGGYGPDATGYLDPSAFITAHRAAR